MEANYDPGNYGVSQCKPTGELPSCSHLSKVRKMDMHQPFQQHSELFSGKLGTFKGMTHDIDVGGHNPIKQHYYTACPVKIALLKKEVDEMLNLGIVRPSTSE